MGKLYCLLGKSASGKDTLYKKLIEDETLALKSVVTYTTRPKRDGEEEGREYHFTDEKKLSELRERGLVAEERVYHTVAGDWYYFTADEGDLDLTGGDRLMIATPAAFKALRKYLGSEKTVPLYITLDDGERLSRALTRERSQKEPRYAELCRRFLADEADFSEDNLKDAGITGDDHYENTDLDACLLKITERIRNGCA